MGALTNLLSIAERVTKGREETTVMRRCLQECCGEQDVLHTYTIESVLVDERKSPPFFFLNLNAYEVQEGQFTANKSSMSGAGAVEDPKSKKTVSVVNSRHPLKVDEVIVMYGEKYILYNIIFYKQRPYHYWVGARQKSDWYEIGLKDLSSSKITESRMRTLKNGNMKGLVYVKCQDVIPIMLSSLQNVLAESVGEARPACTPAEWEEALPLMEELCPYFAFFFVRLFENYLNCTCSLQAIIIILLNIPSVKKISLNHKGTCYTSATVLCDYCLFHKAVQNYANSEISDLEFYNTTYIPQYLQEDVALIEGTSNISPMYLYIEVFLMFTF